MAITPITACGDRHVGCQFWMLLGRRGPAHAACTPLHGSFTHTRRKGDGTHAVRRRAAVALRAVDLSASAAAASLAGAQPALDDATFAAKQAALRQKLRGLDVQELVL